MDKLYVCTEQIEIISNEPEELIMKNQSKIECKLYICGSQ